MLKNITMIGAAIAMTASAFVAAAPASAQSYRDGYYQQYRGDRHYPRQGYRDDRGYRGDYRQYRGRDSRNYRCDNGDGGTVIGAIAGGLLGNSVAGRGDRTTGAILGGALGALAGRSIDRNDGHGRRC